MIVGLGIDSVDVHRFESWHTYSKNSLKRILSEKEIDYCVQEIKKSPERFAVRFAAKEAFFKALCQAHPRNSFTLLGVATHCQLVRTTHGPELSVNWVGLGLTPLRALVSITHTHKIASAVVILEK